MVRVAPVKLQVGTKVLWFDPNGNDVHKDGNVIVKTERGIEYGCATSDILEVSDELVANLKSPLKPVVRIADEADNLRAAELSQQGEEALSVFKELAAETSEQMRPVMVEFLFDGDKAVFYFEAEERVDFRDLVRRLASHFHVRIDMRQIGVRDGARIVGGLGHCGQELCCKRLGGEFSPVSIRMAKEQNLSLNPQKISGCCGRLMCCLRYEYEAYKEVNARAPKHGAKIEIPDGVARVSEVNVPLERVSLQLPDGRTIQIPLEEMDIVGEGRRPNSVSAEVFEKYASSDPLEGFTTSSIFEVSTFTGNEKLADPKARRPHPSEEKEDRSHRKPRRRRRSSADRSSESSGQDKRSGQASSEKDGKKESRPSSKASEQGRSSRKPRRSRSKSSGKQGGAEQQQGAAKAAPEQSRSQGKQRSQRRPGQKSSGVRNDPNKPQGQANRPQSEGKGETAHRKPRRRRRRPAGGDQSHE